MSKSGNQRSKSHHEIPKWLLKNFCTPGSKFLWVGFKQTKEVKHIHRKRVFARDDGNTRIDYKPKGDGSFEAVKSDIDETKLAKRDSEWAKVARQVLEVARDFAASGHLRLPFPADAADACKELVVAQARRTRESQDRAGLTDGNDATYARLYAKRAQELGFDLRLDAEFQSAPAVQKVFSNLNGNLRANFASRADPALAEKERAFLRRCGLSVVVVERPGSDLVIGSHGITIVPTRSDHNSWLPIAPDVAIGLTNKPNSCSFGRVDQGFVEIHNLAALELSKRIAGRSQSLVTSLVNSAELID